MCTEVMHVVIVADISHVTKACDCQRVFKLLLCFGAACGHVHRREESDTEPDEEEYEAYTGNEGPTVQ
jgi:hypothetical protein